MLPLAWPLKPAPSAVAGILGGEIGPGLDEIASVGEPAQLRGRRTSALKSKLMQTAQRWAGVFAVAGSPAGMIANSVQILKRASLRRWGRIRWQSAFTSGHLIERGLGARSRPAATAGAWRRCHRQ